jgi:hypothetical protein
MLQSVQVSVGRTWRLVADDLATVSVDQTDYRDTIDALKSGAEPGDFKLPWPAYRSRLWKYMYNGSYQNTNSRVLVATLLPLAHWATLPRVPAARTPGSVEVLHHPFALSAVAHFELAVDDLPVSGQEAAAALQTMLQAPLTNDCQVRDGVPMDALPALPTRDADGRRTDLEEAGTFLLLSGLHHSSPDPGQLASALANLFDGTSTNGALSLKGERSALAVSSGRVALVLPNSQYRAGERVRCLHHNVATLLGQLQNLATLPPATPTFACEWFRSRAAAVLNHLYRRAPLTETTSIYKSRVPQAWMDHRQLTPSVNALTGHDLPALPTP